MAQAVISTHEPISLTLRDPQHTSRSRRRQRPSGKRHAVNKQPDGAISDEGRQSEKTKTSQTGGWELASGTDNGNVSSKLALLAATTIGTFIFAWVSSKVQKRMSRHPMRSLEGEVAQVLEDPKLERRISKFNSTHWKEYAVALEKVKQMELATSNAQAEGSSGSAASISASRQESIVSAVISHLDVCKDALNAEPAASSSTHSFDCAATPVKRDMQEASSGYKSSLVSLRLQQSPTGLQIVEDDGTRGRQPSSDDEDVQIADLGPSPQTTMPEPLEQESEEQEQCNSGLAKEAVSFQCHVAETEEQPEHLKEHSDSLRTSIESIIQSSGTTEEGIVIGPVTRRHVLKHGMPISEELQFYKNFVLSFDFRTRIPRWVQEHITREQTQGDANRKNMRCYKDKELNSLFSSNPSAYKGSKYDKGHMAAAANHKDTLQNMLQTFVMSNICPMVGPGFNRDYWARFEHGIRLLTHTYDDVYVVTGPLFLPVKTTNGYEMQHPMIGLPPTLVAVPTHFFKVVMAETSAGESADSSASREVVIAAFVLPNAVLQADVPLTAFIVPLQALEQAAGLLPLPDFLDAARCAELDTAALAYRKWVPGTSPEYFWPLQLPNAPTELEEVASSAVVQCLGAASSGPTGTSSAVEVIFENGPGMQSRGVGGTSLIPSTSDSFTSQVAVDGEKAGDGASRGKNGKKARRSRLEKTLSLNVHPRVDHLCGVVECEAPEDW